MNMAEAEKMALAVLKGDVAAACALADALRDEHGEGRVTIPHVKTITANRDRLQAVLTTQESLGGDVEIRDGPGLQRLVEEWLRGELKVLTLVGLNMALYELPLLRPYVGNPNHRININAERTVVGNATSLSAEEWQG